MKNKKKITAYFSMEFAFSSKIPNYAGGLGILAADTMYSCADLEQDVVGITLLYHQDDAPSKAYDPSPFMTKLPQTVTVEIENRTIKVAVWKMEIKGKTGHIVPVYFLSSFLPENPRWDRDLTKFLYASDRYTRLGQEMILGVGGVRVLKELGYEVSCYHMNEGHSACLGLEHLRIANQDISQVRTQCTFTTHTPIAAGHDVFEYDLASKSLGSLMPANIKELATPDHLSMTELALSLSHKVNAVSQKHGEVCAQMFPHYQFESITNGIYHCRWAGDAMRRLFSSYIKGWEEDPALFKQAVQLVPENKLLFARRKEKKNLIDWINAHRDFLPLEDLHKDEYLDEDVLTIGFARRFVPYKRPTLIFHNLDKLRQLGYKKLQLIFAGKCHQDDQFCMNIRSSIGYFANALRGQVKVVLIPDYNLDIGKRLTTGCDVWLNNPLPPREASGTSGMKAALNGVLNLSVLDGWWIEGYKMAPKAGWGFGEKEDLGSDNRDESDFNDLMECLEDLVDCYYHRQDEWILRMKHAITLAAYFNTHRMVQEYQSKMWTK